MALCADCQSLVGKLKNEPPHANLAETSHKKWTGGYAKGVVIDYKCSACGAEWNCDKDKKDAHAGWELEKSPL